MPPPTPAEALRFHVSFDEGPDADLALGDAQIYTAPSWDELAQAAPGLGNPDVVLAPDAGRFGSALKFGSKNTHAIFYRAGDNVGYSPSSWEGTVSFWLSLDPAVDLEPGFCDPIQITDQAYNDAAVWVDFTAENPRQFRLGVLGDLEVWNADGVPATESPFFAERVIVEQQPPFASGEWTHVAIAFSGLNTGVGGEARLYLNGRPVAAPALGIDEPFTWNPNRGAIRLGINYVGLYDDLAVFGRALTDREVLAVYESPDGIRGLLD